MRRLVLTLLATTAFAGAAMAADMPARMATKAPMAPPPYNWTGFYVGLNAGGSWGTQDNALVTITGVTAATNSNNLNGFIGGGQIGYNWQMNQWVFGLEADFQGSSQKDDGTFFIPGGALLLVVPATSVAYTDKLNWFGTVRGRLGWAFDRWLPYVTGGWAYGHGTIDGTTTIAGVTTSFSGSQDYSGWTLGGGLEWAFMNNWSARVEYLYIDFGDGPTVAVSPAFNIVSGKMTDNIVRAGLNVRF